MYKVTFTESKQEAELVEAKYIHFQGDMYVFYNHVDKSDLDSPIAVYNLKVVSRINKINEGSNK